MIYLVHEESECLYQTSFSLRDGSYWKGGINLEHLKRLGCGLLVTGAMFLVTLTGQSWHSSTSLS